MLEDKVLLWKLKRGDENALHWLYEKYKRDMFGLAVSLSNDKAAGEDIVHDVFVSFVRISPKLKLRANLRSYLLASIANRARSLGRTKTLGTLPCEMDGNGAMSPQTPDRVVLEQEREHLVEQAMSRLPHDQREIITLHLQGGMRFREIAASQNMSINTVQSRYRYGLQKLRALLDGKVSP